MKTPSLKVFSLISIRDFEKIGILLGLSLAWCTGRILASEDSGEIAARVGTVVSDTSPAGSELATGQGNLAVEILEIRGVHKSSNGMVARITIDLGTDYKLRACQRQIQNDVQQGRCTSEFFKEIAIESSAASEASLVFGRLTVPQNGWEGYSPVELNLLPVTNYDRPFEDAQPALRLGPKALPAFTLFVTNDVTTAFPSRGEFANRRTQPTEIFEWRETQCKSCLLIQFGNYDMNHSQFANVGLSFASERWNGFLDLQLDARDRKYLRVARRSKRWDAATQLEWKWNDQQSLYGKANWFRLDTKGLPDEEQQANRPGQIDQNYVQWGVGYFWRPSTQDLRYFGLIQGGKAKFYDSYPSEVYSEKRALALSCGIIAKVASSRTNSQY